MGGFVSTIWEGLKTLYYENYQFDIDREPVCFVRAEDYDHCGQLKPISKQNWRMAIKSMATWDLRTRRIFRHIIKRRLININAAEKFTRVSIKSMEKKFPCWDEVEIREMRDLFQVFEVDGDGVIEIAELCIGLDTLGDKTSLSQRYRILSAADSDNSGRIDFEEFLHIAYDLIITHKAEHELARTFLRIKLAIQYIAVMSAPQAAQTGFL